MPDSDDQRAHTNSLEEYSMVIDHLGSLDAAAAGVATGMPDLRAAGYDLIVRGGRVIDPSLGIDGVHDVAVTGGQIAEVEANIEVDAAQTIDARGKLVVPGLI